MKPESINTANAPAAIGPYSQGIRAGQFLFISGQLPLDPATGQIVEGDIKKQTVLVLKNIQAILQAARLDLDNVVKTTIFLKDIDNFAAVNEIYAGFFAPKLPARAVIQAAALPKGADLEIEAVAWGS